ncbi:MAG: LysE family translocator [Pseudomonadales bacterium]|nr:LysE family translocator [Pseudomonadales bacterium]
MIFDFYLIVAYVAAIILFLSTPGPVTILVMNSSIQNGFRAGLATITGTNLASILLMLASFLVVEGVFSVNNQALKWLALVGSLYIMYFSKKIITSKVLLLDNTTRKVSKKHFQNGFIIGISNPKDIIFFIAFLPTFFSITNNMYASMILLTAIWIVLDYLILSLYSVMFSKIVNEKKANLINKTSGYMLLGIAIYALYASMNSII